MTYFLYFSIVIGGLLFRKSKVISVYIFIAMYVLAAFNYSNADYSMYTKGYAENTLSLSNYRYFGYSTLIHIIGNMGLNYSQYLKIAFLILFSLMFFAIKMLTDKPNPVFSYYMIFSFGLDVVQLKAFYSEVFALMGIAFFLKYISSEHKKKRIKLCVSIGFGLLSMLFHFSGAYYIIAGLVYYFVKNRRNYKRKVVVFALIAFLAIYVGLLPVLMSFANRIGLISNMDYLGGYAQKSTRFGFLVTFLGVYLIIGACWPNMARKNILEEQDLQTDLHNYILTIALLFPLLFMNWTFVRLVRVYLVLMYIYFVNQSKSIKMTTNQAMSYTLFIMSIGYFFYIEMFGTLENTLGAILQYSEIL